MDHLKKRVIARKTARGFFGIERELQVESVPELNLFMLLKYWGASSHPDLRRPEVLATYAEPEDSNE
jgi:hypothetical protein